MFRRRSKSSKKAFAASAAAIGNCGLIDDGGESKIDQSKVEKLHQFSRQQLQQQLEKHRELQQENDKPQNVSVAANVIEGAASLNRAVSQPCSTAPSSDLLSSAQSEHTVQSLASSGHQKLPSVSNFDGHKSISSSCSGSSFSNGSSNALDILYHDPPWVKDSDSQDSSSKKDDRKKLRGTRRQPQAQQQLQDQFQQNRQQESQMPSPASSTTKSKSSIRPQIRQSVGSVSPKPSMRLLSAADIGFDMDSAGVLPAPALAKTQSAPLKLRMPKLFRNPSTGSRSDKTALTVATAESGSVAAALPPPPPPPPPAHADLITLIKGGGHWAHATQMLLTEMEAANNRRMFKLHGTKTKANLIHLAVCQPSVTAEFVQELIVLNSRAVSTPDEEFGRLPLHWASISAVSPEVLLALIDAHPHSAKVVDKRLGRLPLHYSMVYSTYAEQAEVVWKAAKRAVQHRDKNGKTPFELTKENPNEELQLDLLAVLQGFHERRLKMKQARDEAEAETQDQKQGAPPTEVDVPASRSRAQLHVPPPPPPQTPPAKPSSSFASPRQRGYTSDLPPVTASPVSGNVGYGSPHLSRMVERKLPKSPHSAISKIPVKTGDGRNPTTGPNRRSGNRSLNTFKDGNNSGSNRSMNSVNSINSMNSMNSVNSAISNTMSTSSGIALLTTIAPNFSTAPLMPTQVSPTDQQTERAISQSSTISSALPVGPVSPHKPKELQMVNSLKCPPEVPDFARSPDSVARINRDDESDVKSLRDNGSIGYDGEEDGVPPPCGFKDDATYDDDASQGILSAYSRSIDADAISVNSGQMSVHSMYSQSQMQPRIPKALSHSNSLRMSECSTAAPSNSNHASSSHVPGPASLARVSSCLTAPDSLGRQSSSHVPAPTTLGRASSSNIPASAPSNSGRTVSCPSAPSSLNRQGPSNLSASSRAGVSSPRGSMNRTRIDGISQSTPTQNGNRLSSPPGASSNMAILTTPTQNSNISSSRSVPIQYNSRAIHMDSSRSTASALDRETALNEAAFVAGLVDTYPNTPTGAGNRSSSPLVTGSEHSIVLDEAGFADDFPDSFLDTSTHTASQPNSFGSVFAGSSPSNAEDFAPMTMPMESSTETPNQPRTRSHTSNDTELLVQMTQSISHLNDQIFLQDEELGYRENRLREIDEIISSMSGGRLELTNKLRLAQAKVEEHQTDLSNRRRAARSIREQIAHLQAELSAAEADLEEAEGQTFEYELELAETQTALEEFKEPDKERLAQLQEERLALVQEKEEIEMTHTTMKSELESLKVISDMVRLEQ